MSAASALSMPATKGSSATLTCDGLVVSFSDAGGQKFRAVDVEKIRFEPGRLHLVSGPSGSGKSTLLYAIAGLAELESGCIRFGDDILSDLSEARRDAWRRRHVGMVFQSFHLIPELNAEDNVLLPAWFGGFRASDAQRARTKHLLETLGVPAGRGAVARLSRGEQQRVALASQALVAATLAGVLAIMELYRTELAVLRALGATRGYIFLTIWGYVTLFVLTGALLGLALGVLVAIGVSSAFTADTGIALSARLGEREFLLATGLVVVGLALALLPAWMIYRRPVLDSLR